MEPTPLKSDAMMKRWIFILFVVLFIAGGVATFMNQRTDLFKGSLDIIYDEPVIKNTTDFVAVTQPSTGQNYGFVDIANSCDQIKDEKICNANSSCSWL